MYGPLDPHIYINIFIKYLSQLCKGEIRNISDYKITRFSIEETSMQMKKGNVKLVFIDMDTRKKTLLNNTQIKVRKNLIQKTKQIFV